MSFSLFLAGFVVFFTHALEAVAGFGCTVLALPFVTMLLGLEQAKVILTVLAWVLALYFVLTKFRQIDFRQFFIIVSLTGLGMPLGIYLFATMSSDALKTILGVFIIVASSIQLSRLFGFGKKMRELPRWFFLVILFCGGIIHGAFASGGPFVVLYASRAIPDKGKFRATLCLLWTTLNTFLMVSFLWQGIFTPTIGVQLLWMAPFLIVGLAAGELIHNRVPSLLFWKLVFSMLFVTGFVMLV